MVNSSGRSNFIDQGFYVKITTTPYVGIWRSYQLETFTTKSPWQRIWLMTLFFNFYWRRQKSFVVYKIRMGHVTKIMTSSINIFCQVAPWWKFRLHIEVKIKSRGRLALPTSSIFLIYLNKLWFSWQDVSL